MFGCIALFCNDWKRSQNAEHYHEPKNRNITGDKPEVSKAKQS